MAMPLDATSGLALDAQSLSRLRLQAKDAPNQALKAAAQQFEAVFLNMMLKSMREATPQDGMLDSDQTRMFTGMLDQQFAQSMASRGVGLADIMVKQLSRGMGGQPGGDLSVTKPPVLNAIPSAYNKHTQQDFVNRMWPLAKQASVSSGVPTQLILGQAALESGWGKREIRLADGGNSFNLFGIKATSEWKGKVAEVMTTEYVNGVAHQEVARFRAYASYGEAFRDYANLIGTNPRYADAMHKNTDAVGMAHAIQKAGYASDPQYAEKLVRVMEMIESGA